MFNEVVLLHGEVSTPGAVPGAPQGPQGDKTTQTGEEEGEGHEPLTCQELLALSGALSAALPTGQTALNSLFSTLGKGVVIGDPLALQQSLQQQQDLSCMSACPAACPVCNSCRSPTPPDCCVQVTIPS